MYIHGVVQIVLLFYSGHGDQLSDTNTPRAVSIDGKCFDMLSKYVEAANSLAAPGVSNAIILLMDACLASDSDFDSDSGFLCPPQCVQGVPCPCIPIECWCTLGLYSTATPSEESTSPTLTNVSGSSTLTESNLIVVAHGCEPGKLSSDSSPEEYKFASHQGNISCWTASLVEAMSQEEAVRDRSPGDVMNILARCKQLLPSQFAVKNQRSYAMYKPGVSLSTVSIARYVTYYTEFTTTYDFAQLYPLFVLITAAS
jgi:Caspase domain